MSKSKVEEAVSVFDKGFVCSQAVLSSYAGPLGLAPGMALKLAESFGAGMGCMGETCGAVTGAYMVIGLKYGRTRAEDVDAKEKTRALVREFNKRFKEKHKTAGGNQLLGQDITTTDSKKKIEDEGLFDTRCPLLVKDAAEILEALMD